MVAASSGKLPTEQSGGASERTYGVTRRLIRLAAPIVGLNLLNVLALVIDTAMCGRLPEAGVVLAALSFAIQVIFLLMVAMMGLSVGTVALVARGHGAGDTRRVQHVIGQATGVTVFLGVLVAIVGNVVAPYLVRALGASEAATSVAMGYLRPMLSATVLSYLMLLFAAILRGVQNTRLPFLVAIGTNIVNVALNYCLILGNFGFPALGLVGAAIGTICAQALGAAVLMVAVRKGVIRGVALRVPDRIDNELLGRMVRIGGPAAFDMLILNAAFVSIVGMLGRIDDLAVAAHGVGLRIQTLAIVPGMGISQATAAMVGNALGAGDLRRARSVLSSSVLLCTLLMTVLGVAIVVLVEPLVALFDIQPGTSLWSLTATWIRILGYAMPVIGIYIAFVGLLQGAGATSVSLRINVISTVVVQIPLSYVLGFSLNMGAFGIWLAFPLSFVIKAGLGGMAYRKGDWAQVGDFGSPPGTKESG